MYNNIFLLIITIHYLLFLIIRPKFNILACGVFGWAGSNIKNFSQDKVNFLGISNQKRGTDSCGISVNSNIFKGINSKEKYKDFMVDVYHDKTHLPKEVCSFIGHTRSASHGNINLSNAHPFGFGENKKTEKYNFIGVHNGTLYNKKNIAKKYNVNLKREATNIEKIDSEILLECLYKSNNYEVLSDYNGGAAIVFTKKEEPKTIYVFRGASKKGTIITEERPLYYYIEKTTSLYFSSLKESLFLIGGTENTIKSFDTNVLYKIKDGNIAKAELIKISREEQDHNYKSENYFSRLANNINKSFIKPVEIDYETDQYTNGYYNSGYFPKYDKTEIIKNESELTYDLDDFEENVNNYKGMLYCKKNLKYYRNGHLASGIYMFIETVGIVYVSHLLKDAKEKVNFWEGKEYSKGKWMLPLSKVPLIPIPIFDEVLSKKAEEYLLYFYKGYMLKTPFDYTGLGNVKNLSYNFSLKGLSEATFYPILDNNNKAFLNGKECLTAYIKPIGSTKKFVIKSGELSHIRVGKISTDKERSIIIPSYSKSNIRPPFKELIFNNKKKVSTDLTLFNNNNYMGNRTELEKKIITNNEEAILSVISIVEASNNTLASVNSHTVTKRTLEAFSEIELILGKLVEEWNEN